MISNFYDLDVWQKAHSLVLDIYKITELFPQSELFGIISQIRRAVTSITANVAEGFERFHFKDKIKFYHQARGSLGEVENFLILSRDLKFISSEQYEMFAIKIKEIRKLINGLINSIEKQK